MQVHSIISKTISEEILRSGHLSIRFMRDGFSLLLEDRSYNPVILNRFTHESAMSQKSHILACKDWLDRHTLIKDFSGEITLVADSIPATLIPSTLFDEKNAFLYLDPVTTLRAGEKVMFREIKNRPFFIVYAVNTDLVELAGLFRGTVRIKTTQEILLSVSDQVNAADHQRGFALAEIQTGFLGFLVIKNDKVVILNQFTLKSGEEMVYHILNALQQLEFDRKTRPLFIAGTEMGKEVKDLNKYVRHIEQVPYHINEIDKLSIPEHILLAEATRCE